MENRAQFGTRESLIILSILPAIALAVGLYIGAQVRPSREADPINAIRLAEVDGQSRLLQDAVASDLEAIRAQAMEFRSARALDPKAALPEKIQHWTELELDESTGAVKGILQSASRGPVLAPAEFLAQVIRGRRSKAGLGAFAMKPYLGLELPDGNRRMIVALVDPQKAFSVFTTYVGRTGAASGLRAYLVLDDGQILAHSQPGYVGTSFKDTDIFRQGLRPLLEGTRISGTGTYRSIDNLPVLAGYFRLSSLPIGVVVEKVSTVRDTLAGNAGYALIQKMVGQTLLAIGCLAFLILGAAAWLRRRFSFTEEPTESFEEILTATPVVDATAIPELSKAIETHELAAEARAELQAARETVRTAREERALLEAFEKEAVSLRDPKAIAARLTAAATKLAQSPTLFFAYNDGLRTAGATASAGFAAGEERLGISLMIDPEALSRVHEAERRGEIASLASYEPLGKLLLSKVGVAHFEAWAVTGYGQLGRQAGRARLLGILVILQAGIDSATRYDSLSRMMRTTGLIYENALLTK